MFARRIAQFSCAVVLSLTTTLVAVAPANAHTRGSSPTLGTSSLATLLAKDGSGFDRNPNDFDITDAAVRAVLKAKPTSAVAVLANGKAPLTAFLPTDRAFRRLAHDLTGRSITKESEVFSTLAKTLGVDTIETVLLYHVVPGATIDYKTALRSNGVVLKTALTSATVKVKVRYCVLVTLADADTNDANPLVVSPNLNRHNVQIAHGINRVLRPVDLP